MKSTVPMVIVGVVLLAMGSVWTLQGLNVLGGSAMSGSSLWATIGPIVLLVGLVLMVVAFVRRRGSRR